MTLSVATIVSQAVLLKYPIVPVLESVRTIADEIVVNVDISRNDGTWQMLCGWMDHQKGFPVTLRGFFWDWMARDAGQELARQTNLAFNDCTKDWILYLQADEVVHEDDHEDIRWLLDLPEEFTAVQFMRLYFFGSPKTLRKDWTQPLVRMFRRGRAKSVGDAMNCETDGLVWPCFDGIPRLFHYSRVADSGVIGQRIRNLDGLFHPEEDLSPARPYDFGLLKQFDTHAVTEKPPEVSLSVLQAYSGSHPAPMVYWLRGQGFQL